MLDIVLQNKEFSLFFLSNIKLRFVYVQIEYYIKFKKITVSSYIV